MLSVQSVCNETSVDYNSMASVQDINPRAFEAAICEGGKFSGIEYWLLNENRALIAIRDETTFYFKGKLRVHVQTGSLACLGFTLQKDHGPKEVYSPRGYSLLCFKASIDEEAPQIDDLKSLGLSKEHLKEVKTLQDKNKRVFVIFGMLNCGWIDFIDEQLHYSEKMSLFRRDVMLPQMLKVSSPCPELEKWLDINLVTGNYENRSRLYTHSEQWSLALQSLRLTSSNDERPVLLAAGGKGVGKSTLLRFLINRSIQMFGSVVYVDLDPGQTEFTIPGSISCLRLAEPIFGPNFCHLREPDFSVFVGDVNMSNCHDRYLKCVEAVQQFCSRTYVDTNVPWLVNTMGFVHGLGVLFCVETIRCFRPTTVVEIRSRFDKKNFRFNLFPDNVSTTNQCFHKQRQTPPLAYNLLRFDAIPESQEAKDMRAKDLWGIPDARRLREIVMLSYLGRFLPGLFRSAPYRVSLQNVAIQVLGVEAAPPQTELFRLLNLRLVSLSKVSALDFSEEGSFLVANKTVIEPSVGFGIVRAIDPKEQILYLVTNVSPTELQTVNCLTVGALFLPDCLIKSQSLDSAPYASVGHSSNRLSRPWQRSGKPKGNQGKR